MDRQPLNSRHRTAPSMPSDAVNGPIDRLAELRRMPRLAFGALRTVRLAAARPLTGMVACQVLIAVLIGAQLYVGKVLVGGLIAASDDPDVGPRQILLSFGALVVVGALISVLNATLFLQQRLL